MYMYCAYDWWLFSRGAASFQRGASAPPLAPLNETLVVVGNGDLTQNWLSVHVLYTWFIIEGHTRLILHLRLHHCMF